GFDRVAVFPVDRPASGEITPCHGPSECSRKLDDLLLHVASPPCDGLLHELARIGNEMLDLREHAGRDIRIAVAGDAAARRADACEVVLARPDIAPLAAARAVGEKVRL